MVAHGRDDGWNSLEAAIAIASGMLAGSIALVGFGLDSVVEVTSAVIIAWLPAQRGASHEASERAERRAARLIGLSFFGIAVYVVVDATIILVGFAEEPQRTPLGLAITVLSLLVVPGLAWAKRRVATCLGSVALKADAAETQLVRISQLSCSWGWPPINSLGGGGWTQSRVCWSPLWLCERVSRRGEAANSAAKPASTV